ncbi:MAG: PLP-dependent aspartate aminotransferase family protein [Coriobacteriales bacterium]|nr:PLP-dependent aspartate aminotransferase family protein [Coriobacteriales bacterium]
MNFSTRCIHTQTRFADPVGSLVMPLYMTASYAHDSLGANGSHGDYDYSRLQNPTREALEDTVRDLEGGIDCLAFSSGMAAIACLMELFRPGDEIVTSWDLYGGSIRLFDAVTRKNGVKVQSVDTSDLDAVARLITPATRAIYVESPTNPLMVVSDIRRLAQLAHDNDALLVVDNTFLTPYFCNPLKLGADVVVHSGTKYLCGHNDVVCGFVVTSRQDVSDQLRYLIKTIGSGLSPFDAWLVARGLKTLPLRMERHQQSALAIAQWLQGNPKVTQVTYTGLPDNPDHQLCLRQGTGFGGMVTFRVDTPETARRVLENVHLILFAESLGGAESLITYPLTQTHADVPADELAQKGIDGCLLRLSVGLEDPQDLIADLQQALA